ARKDLGSDSFGGIDDGAKPSETSGSGSRPPAPRLTKRPASGNAAAPARPSRPSGSAHDPLSGPWPSFTRRTGETASQTIPAKKPDDVEQPPAAGSGAAADRPAAAAETAAGEMSV